MPHAPVLEIGLFVSVALFKALVILCVLQRNKSRQQPQQQQQSQGQPQLESGASVDMTSVRHPEETVSQDEYLTRVVIAIPEPTSQGPSSPVLPPPVLLPKPPPDIPEAFVKIPLDPS